MLAGKLILSYNLMIHKYKTAAIGSSASRPSLIYLEERIKKTTGAGPRLLNSMILSRGL